MKKIKWLFFSLLSLIIIQNTSAKLVWQSEQKHLGYVLASGGWDVRYHLGTTPIGVEIQIPLLLVYNPANESRSGQWSNPQLESSVMPVSKEVIKWVQPGGDVMLFALDPKDKGNYSSRGKDWRMGFKARSWDATDNSKESFLSRDPTGGI
jgi:hypothetical protein